VSVARFEDPQPARTIGMVWRKRSPLAAQLRQLSDVVGRSARGLRPSGSDTVAPPPIRATVSDPEGLTPP